MPYGGVQIIIQVIDFDKGDDVYYGDYLQMMEFLQTCLLSMKMLDRDKGKDRLELVLRNDDFKMIDSPVFAKGQKLLVTWGWPGDMVAPRRFVVQSVRGGDKITVVAHCRLSLLDRIKTSRFSANITHSEFVRTVVEEYGYTGPYQWIEETKIRTDITQSHMTDARFLNRLARRNGFVFYEDASGIHWHARNLQSEPVRWFIYKQDEARGDILAAPTFDINMTFGISKVKVTYRDPQTKEWGECIGGPDDTELDSLGEETEMGNPDDLDQGRRAGRMSREDVRYGGVMSREEAQVEANARYYETAVNKYKMEVPIIGDSAVGAKLLVGFAGISEMLDGLYYIHEAEHNIAGGQWTITLRCSKNAVNVIKTAKSARRGSKEKKNPAVNGTIIAKEVQTLSEIMSLTTDSFGNKVPAYTFVDSGGNYVLPLAALTATEMARLSDQTLEKLYQARAQSAEPGTNM